MTSRVRLLPPALARFRTAPRLAALVVMLFSLYLVLAPTAYAHSSGQLHWARRYDSPVHGEDGGSSVAIDDYGYAYVTGTVSTAASGWDMVTIKYHPSGAKMWARRWDGLNHSDDRGADVAVDALQNVYVLGATFDGYSYNLVTVKYDRLGNKKWAKTYDDPVNGVEYAREVAVDYLGYIYVGCTSSGGATGVDYVVIKYRPDGLRSWAKRYDGDAHGNDDLEELTLDERRNVIVTGESPNTSGNRDFLTVKYSPAGTRLWAKRRNPATAKDEKGEAVAVDAAGNVYVAGSGMNVYGDEDAIIVKYSAAGAFRWADQYDRGPGSDGALSLGVGPDNCPVLGGFCRNSAGNDDGLVMKFSPHGNRIWRKFYDGPLGGVNGHDWFRDIVVDGSGNVFTAGGSANLAGNPDLLTVRYSRGGTKMWARRFDVWNGEDEAEAIAKRPGAVFVAGFGAGLGTGQDVVTLRYQP